MRYLIYGLIDPRDHFIHYIGQSSTGLTRPRWHARPAALGEDAKSRWILELFAYGLSYEVVVLEHVESPDAPTMCCCWWNEKLKPTALHEAERWWIALGTAFGWPLTNATRGGDGTRGYVHTAETLDKLRNRKLSPETRARMSVSAKARIARDGNHLSAPDVVEKRANSHRGLKRSDKIRAEISERSRRRWTTPEMLEYMRGPNNPSRSPEARAKISAAKLGVTRERSLCGTAAAYSYAIKKRRAGEANCGPCVACKRAEADAVAARRKLKNGQKS